MESAWKSSGMQINFHWGIDELQGRDSSNKGTIVYDDRFTVSSEENQAALLDFCESLLDSSKTVDCWIKDLDDFVFVEYLKLLPIKESDFNQYLLRFVTESAIGHDHVKRGNLNFE